MDNIIFITGALGIGYLIYKNTDNTAEKKNIEKSEVLEAVPETKQQEKKIEVTKIGLLPTEDKKALLMNLKNAKPYSSTFAIVTAVVGGVFTSFYISKKMFIVIYEYYKISSTGGLTGAYGFPIESINELLPSGFSFRLDLRKRLLSDKIKSDIAKANLDAPPREKIEFDTSKQEKLDEIEKKNEDEIFEEDPMLSQGNIPLTDFTGKTGTNFIPFTSDEIKIEENVKMEENIRNANINQIDNISIGVEKEEPKVELTEEEILKNEKKLKLLEELKEFLMNFNNNEISYQDLFQEYESYFTFLNYWHEMEKITNNLINNKWNEWSKFEDLLENIENLLRKSYNYNSSKSEMIKNIEDEKKFRFEQGQLIFLTSQFQLVKYKIIEIKNLMN